MARDADATGERCRDGPDCCGGSDGSDSPVHPPAESFAGDGPTTRQRRAPLADGGRPSRPDDDGGRLERRDVAKVLATIGGLTAVGSLAAPLAGLTQVFERPYTGPVYSDGVTLVDADGDRMTEDALSVGGWTTVFPEPRPTLEEAPTLLVRYAEGEYAEPTNPAFVVSGYAAYSKVCTHAGCMVSEREDDTLVCPCHFGKFDPLAGARVVGGPPPRALPQLPLTLSADGYLVATGDFEAPVGPGGG